MQLSDIYIYALKQLKGFDEDAVEKAIELAKNDVVESVEEFIDFINFNIEDRKFPQLSQPYEEQAIRKAVKVARKNEGRIVHHVTVDGGEYPQKLLQAQIVNLNTLSYKGNLKNLDRKTIMITGSSSLTNNAKLAARYLGKVFASNGYNILTTFLGECEQSCTSGCVEAGGTSTFFLPHDIEHLSVKEKKIVQDELEAGHSTVISASNAKTANVETIEETYPYLTALADCLIVPQISNSDRVMQFVRNFLTTNKPVFLIKYKARNCTEYRGSNILELLGAKYLSSNTALNQVIDAIGTEQIVNN